MENLIENVRDIRNKIGLRMKQSRYFYKHLYAKATQEKRSLTDNERYFLRSLDDEIARLNVRAKVLGG